MPSAAPNPAIRKRQNQPFYWRYVQTSLDGVDAVLAGIDKTMVANR
ncbi:hypothetical protein KCP78_05920 [Salmonella enterica subsp. enterica]|nr:hypothetical protein KCP78_05920 [Salmonella enterica subsp. enterica]